VNRRTVPSQDRRRKGFGLHAAWPQPRTPPGGPGLAPPRRCGLQIRAP